MLMDMLEWASSFERPYQSTDTKKRPCIEVVLRLGRHGLEP